MKDWANGLADLGERELIEGFRSAKDFKGYLTMGDFRGMCKAPKGHASFKPYVALPNIPIPKEELKSRIAKMREELWG